MQNDRIESDALTRNLDLTNVLVEIPCSFEVLEEAVRGYAGKEKRPGNSCSNTTTVQKLELRRQETQRYAVGNLRVYRSHPLCGNVLYLLSASSSTH